MNQDHLSIAQATLLEPTGLSETHLSQIMTKLTNVADSDFADMYFQYSKHESWSLDEGQVKTGSFNIDLGVGLRSVCGEKTAFAYSEDLNSSAILNAADVVNAIGRQGQNVSNSQTWKTQGVKPLYADLDPIAALDDANKVAILEYADKVARAHDPRVKEVMASLSGVYEVVLIVTSDGRQIPDVRPLVRLNVGNCRTQWQTRARLYGRRWQARFWLF